MTTHRHVTTTCLALLLGLAACAPAGPVALAPATAATPPAATLAPAPAATLTPPPVPSATPIVLPDSVARAQAAGRLTPAEAAQLAALLAARTADWRIDPADTALRVERTPAGAICLLLTDADGAAIRLIYLTSLEPLAYAETTLEQARAAYAQVGHSDTAAVAYLGLDLLSGLVSAYSAEGAVLGGFDPATGLWQFLPLPTPEPTPAPTETPAPEPRVSEENGVYIARTEKGEVVTAPAVPGTKQGIEAVSGIERVVYRAEAGNPYGLEAGTLAGYFYPDTYTQTLEAKEATATGSLALHPNIVKVLLEQADYKNKGIFALPFRLQMDAEKPLIMLEKRHPETGKDYLFFSIPLGSEIVNPLPSTTNIRVVPQPGSQVNHTLIVYETGAVFAGKQRIDLAIADKNTLKASDQSVKYAQKLALVQHTFTKASLERFKSRLGPVPTSTNANIYFLNVVGDVTTYPISVNNLLQASGVIITLMPTTN